MPTTTIKHYGFDWPPVGLIDVIERCALNQDGYFYILDPLTGSQLPYDEIQAADKTNLFVIIHTHEGASHHWFDRLIPALINRGVPSKQIVLYSSCLHDPDSPITHIGSIMQYASTMIDRVNNAVFPICPDTLHHFVCLNRVHRWQRLDLVKKLLDLGLERFGRISYTDTRFLKNDSYRNRFPLIIDYKNPTYDQGHEIDADALTGALLNVICESCYEKRPGATVFESHPCPGFTEKTFKPMFLSQIPIWLAPQGTVELYRDLGFDAFDDLIDHRYDLEHDPIKRITLVAQQIEEFSRRPLDGLSSLRKELAPRFLQNWTHLRSFYNNWNKEIPKWLTFFDKFGLIDQN